MGEEKNQTNMKSITDTELFIPKQEQADGVLHQCGEDNQN